RTTMNLGTLYVLWGVNPMQQGGSCPAYLVVAVLVVEGKIFFTKLLDLSDACFAPALLHKGEESDKLSITWIKDLDIREPTSRTGHLHEVPLEAILMETPLKPEIL